MAMSQNRIRWSFLIGLFLSPLLVGLILSPQVFDYFFPNTVPGVKAIILIVMVVTVLWSMLQSAKEAMYITSWAIVLSTFFTAFEIDQMLPKNTSAFIPASVPSPMAVTATPVSPPRPTPGSRKLGYPPMQKHVDKTNDTLQFSSFDAKEKTPQPTPTATPNTTPFFDFSSWTQKDQSIGALPDSAFFGKNGSSATGGILKFFRSVYQSIFGR